MRRGSPLRASAQAAGRQHHYRLGQCWKNPDGNLQAIVRDITERKRMEEALCRSEEKYRNILENIDDGYYEIDLAGNFTWSTTNQPSPPLHT
jgi:PAS domain-containing protein